MNESDARAAETGAEERLGSADPREGGGRIARVVLWTAALLFGLAMALLVAGAGSRPAMQTFAPSPTRPRAVGDTLVGPLVYTVDAQDDTRWRFFDFSSGSVVERPAPTGWDIAFRRHFIIVNGGDGFSGNAGIQRLEPGDREGGKALPSAGYLETRAGRDSTVRGLGKWYDYSFIRHILEPRPGRFAVRTADGRYAVFQILSYYCEGGMGGCFTLRYKYQGNGTRDIGA